ncbi:long-chain fatty acid--CoA ligase [Mycolicibacterium moriokaense]|uniref:Long-chain-fatty-acid--CoA ligase n=1 Tax=Mycolicibacterium moriokaense TaxID=39691 RepID=A0AAD1M4C9_9MYCO|nr:AMP-binding protein [Mycolicibacterium moriokaense]ORB18543.1 long-chain fatty acid--CoA ligase [Mycolicibacterium moriokaense]BBX00077.1 long-chain-fatty-acid--CoA ligase [Mycolicibacterium moriokaense]
MDWSGLVARHATAKPSDVAVRFDDESITWEQLDAQCDGLASWLAGHRVGRADRVVLLLTNRPQFIVGVVAAHRVGAIAVPVNFRLSAAEIDFILTDTSAAAVITEDRLAGLLTGTYAPPPSVLVIDRETSWRTATSEIESVTYSTDDPAVILYTSGTTGRPKGAVLSHLNLQAQGLALIRTWRLVEETETTLLCLPLFHVGGFVIGSAMLLVGGAMIIAPSGAFEAARTLDTLERERVTSVFMVPTQWQAIVETGLGERDLVLRVAAWGGGPMSASLLEDLNTLFRGAAVVAVFGQTEMTPVASLPGKDAVGKLGSVGKPVDTVAIRVVDEAMNDVPRGQVGELVYRGAALMLEYWERPEATAEAFDGGWFHSGDLGYIDAEGFLYVVDRKKDMIISGGENIYSAEVESTLAAHPDIGEVAVIGRPDNYWGEVPVAVVVPRSPGCPTLDVDTLGGWLEGRLARYKRPKVVHQVDALPRNAGGKVLKHVLKAAFEPGAEPGAAPSKRVDER